MQRNLVSENLAPAEIEILLKYFPKGLVGIDLETTGLSPLADYIIEFGIIKLLPDGTVQQIHQLIKPPVAIPEHTIEYHQITDEMVAGAPAIEECLPNILAFIGDSPIVAHNAQFDLGFLLKAIHIQSLYSPECQIYDSCRFARLAVVKGAEENQIDNYKLSTLAQFFNIPLQHHVALEDAMVGLRILANCLLVSKPDNINHTLFKKSYVYRMSDFKRGRGLILPKDLQGLIPLVQTGHMIEIVYSGGTHLGIRKVKPLAILPLPKGPILYGECQESKLNKSYLLKRIINFRKAVSNESTISEQK